MAKKAATKKAAPKKAVQKKAVQKKAVQKRARATTASAPKGARAAKYVYFFGNGKADGDRSMKDLLGGKGAGLAEMTLAGLPTPPGFTITTEACNDYFANGKALPAGLWDNHLRLA